MFSVLFEVQPRSDQWQTYLGYATMLRPELERIDGFVDNIRYGSLTRDGWILSLSGWRDEKALVRWRTRAGHHDVQQKGRDSVLQDYHLRVGQVTADTRIPPGYALREQRLDETETGEGTTVTLIDAHRPAEHTNPTEHTNPAEHTNPPEQSNPTEHTDPTELAAWLGLDETAAGLVRWDVFDAVRTPGDLILLLSWRDQAAAEAYEAAAAIPAGGRRRRIRVVRDYGMYDRRENPQYYPEVSR
jgi:heme-degrading monooxygenase HmoA